MFRGKPVNYDPREAFSPGSWSERGEHNVFHDFYRAAGPGALRRGGHPTCSASTSTRVIAACCWAAVAPYRAGALGDAALEIAAFTVFLYGRMAGSAAEIDDHLNRGRNMDTRTPASEVRFIV